MKDLVPGFEPIGSWGMFFAPGKTPPEIVNKLNAAVRKALQAPAVATIMQRDGYVPDNRDVAETASVLPQGGRGDGRSGEGRRDRAELSVSRPPRSAPCPPR